MSHQEHQIVIIGAGNAGIIAAAQLLLKDKHLDIVLIDPAKKHYYQPAWTLVGGGTFDNAETARDMKDLIPPRAHWIAEAVSDIDPEQQIVQTDKGRNIHYQYLIVAPGIQVDWDKVKGLPETLGKNGVCSNYGFEYAPYTWQSIKSLKSGRALFTQPNTPIKCGGAPQKIMYLADEAFRKHGVRNNIDIQFFSPGGVVFGVEMFAKTLREVNERKGLKWNFKHNLVEIKADSKEAIFEVSNENGELHEKVEKFDMLHVVPPMSAPDFIKKSKLADPNNPLGWVEVDPATLQHKRYPNVFSMGDVSSAPTAKTGSAIRKQSPVVVNNLLAVMQEQSIAENPTYNGYSSCPLVTGYGKMVLAEFDYQNQPDTTFPFDQSAERFDMWVLKKFMLPWMYWNLMLKGKV